MSVLVVGVCCENMGSCLMLCSVFQALRKRLPDCDLIISPMSGKRAVLKAFGYRLLNFPLPHVGSGYYIPSLTSLMFAGSNVLPGFKLRDVTAVLDVSGFAFGDQFGSHALRGLDHLTASFKRAGSRYILLPQAFGPFERNEMSQMMRHVISNADLLCARDEQSFHYLRALDTETKCMGLFPDITLNVNLCAGEQEFGSDYCCIVPNVRMVEVSGSRDLWQSRYIPLLCQVAEHLYRKHKKKVVIVVHDTGVGDARIARELEKMATVPVQLCIGRDPLELKSVLAGSSLVIGSRFHALVSALSSAVPSIALGWSHKYNEVFSEFELPDCVFSNPDDFNLESLDRLLEEKNYASRKQRLAALTRQKSQELELLWDSVAEIIKG